MNIFGERVILTSHPTIGVVTIYAPKRPWPTEFLVRGTTREISNFTNTYVNWTKAQKQGGEAQTNGFEVIFRVRF